MDEKTTALARELVGASAFRWMAGMLALEFGSKVGEVFRVGRVTDWIGNSLPVTVASARTCDIYSAASTREWFPDLNDPATAGCLLALLAEAVSPGDVCLSTDDGACGVATGIGETARDGSGSTPGAALARALIAASNSPQAAAKPEK